MILLILQIILAIFVFVYIGDIQTAAGKVLERLWEQRANHVSFWDAIQNGVSRNFEIEFKHSKKKKRGCNRCLFYGFSFNAVDIALLLIGF